MRLPIVEVEWEDAEGANRPWLYDDESQEWGRETRPPEVAVGYLVEKNRAFLVLAMLISEACGSKGNMFKIPIGCIRRIRTLRRGGRR